MSIIYQHLRNTGILCTSLRVTTCCPRSQNPRPRPLIKQPPINTGRPPGVLQQLLVCPNVRQLREDVLQGRFAYFESDPLSIHGYAPFEPSYNVM